MIKATCVLITKEKEYPKEVLDSLPEFDELIIETECPSVLRRYELAIHAKNDIIYVQDDDCLVDTKALFEKYNGQLTNFMSPHHKSWYEGTGITLVGWGTYFPKSMVDFTTYLDKYPPDALLLREADRVFTYLNQPHNSIVKDINHLPTATLGDRMSATGEHWDTLNQIKQRLQTL